MKAEELLEEFRRTGALLQGHFELRSKLHSDQYFQCALLLQHPRTAEKLCAALVAKMRGTLGEAQPDAVISPALGGIVVGHEIGRAFATRSIFAEKEDGKLVVRRGFHIRPGERFVVAEDVITRGGRVQETVDIVERAGGKVMAVAVLVDRSAGTAQFAYPTFSLLQLAPLTYEPARCPLCAKGIPMSHPGS